jgi:hypothetical protein
MENEKLTFYKKELDKKTKVYEVAVSDLKDIIDVTNLSINVSLYANHRFVDQILKFMKFVVGADSIEYTATATGFEFISKISLEACRNDNIMHSEHQEIIKLDILNTDEFERYHHYGYEYPKSLNLKSKYEILADVETKGFCIRAIA